VEFEAVFFAECLASRIPNKKEQMFRNMGFCINARRHRSKKYHPTAALRKEYLDKIFLLIKILNN